MAKKNRQDQTHTVAEMHPSKMWSHAWRQWHMMGGWQLPHPQLSENISSPPELVLEAGGFWLKAVMDLGNNCLSRLRMEMRMTVDWQGTLLVGLSLLSGIKVKLHSRDDSMRWVYGEQTCWVRTDVSVIVEENCWRRCCCYQQSNHEWSFGFLMGLFKKPVSFIWSIPTNWILTRRWYSSKWLLCSALDLLRAYTNTHSV